MGHRLGQICVVVRRVDQTPTIPKMVPAQMVQKMDPAQMVQKVDPELQGDLDYHPYHLCLQVGPGTHQIAKQQ